VRNPTVRARSVVGFGGTATRPEESRERSYADEEAMQMKMPVSNFASLFVSMLVARSAFVGAMAAAQAATDAKQLFEQQEGWSGGRQ
jgi:hypothetical protein